MAITLPVSIPSTATDALQPVDEFLLKGFDTNQKYIASQIDTSGGGGSGGGGGTIITQENMTDWISTITSGGESNEGRLWRRRYPAKVYNINPDARDGASYDLIGDDLGKFRVWYSNPEIDYGLSTHTNAFQGGAIRINKNESLFFPIKKGENFFSIGTYSDSSLSDNYSVFVDGQTPSSLGLLDANFKPAPNTYNPSVIMGNVIIGRHFSIFGLDGEEHIVQIKNTDSSTRTMDIQYIDVGYLAPNYTLTNKIKLSSGYASGKYFNGGEFTFDDTRLNGHLGSIVLKPDGTLYAIDGEHTATTFVKADFNIDFPNYPTEIKVRGHYAFPTDGICSITLDTGNTYAFSYAGKSETNINDSKLIGVIWQSVHNEARAGNKWGESHQPPAGQAFTQDFIINYIGSGPIKITNLNNKIDFSVNVKGTITSHTATIPNGIYSFDLVQLSKAINKQMQIAKPIEGKYFVNYDTRKKTWTIGINNSLDVIGINFLFSSGVNSSASIASTLGFSNTDLTGNLSYEGENEVDGLCCRGFQKGPVVDYNSPRMRATVAWTAYNNPQLNLAENYTGVIQTMSPSASGLLIYLPDKNAIGVELTFEGGNDCQGPIMFFVDNKIHAKLSPSYTQQNASTSNPANIYTYFVTFPKGATKISWWTAEGYFDGNNQSQVAGVTKFLFLKELFARPPFEKLKVGEKIIKTFEVAPTPLYENGYFWKASIYIPQGANDRIKSFTTSGTWTYGASVSYLGGYMMYTSTQGAYIDINFDIEKNGGGFSLRTNSYYTAGNGARGLYKLYLSNAPINESTDIFCSTTSASTETIYQVGVYSFIGLKAGNYNLRIKKTNASATDHYCYVNSFSIIDREHQTNCENYQQSVVNQRTVPIPINAFPVNNQKDDEYFLSASEHRTSLDPTNYGTEYAFGYLTSLDQSNYQNPKVSTQNSATEIWGNSISEVSINAAYDASMMGQDIYIADDLYQYSNNWTIFLNGNAKASMSHSAPIVINGGINGSQNTWGSFCRNRYSFVKSCSFSSGDTFLCSNTSDLKVSAPILLFDGVNYEQVKVLTITANVNFTTTKRNLVIDANVISFKASGYHNVKVKNNVSMNLAIRSVYASHLPITHSKYLINLQSQEVQKVQAYFKTITTGTRILGFPIFPDGSRGNQTNTTINVTKISDAATFYQITLGGNGIVCTVTGGGNIDFYATSLKTKG